MRSGSDQRRGSRVPGNRPSQRAQTSDGHGSGERNRGNASQLYQRYLTLAREAAQSDDRVASENFYQYAEHYFRVNKAGRDGNTAAPDAADPTTLETGLEPAERRETMPPGMPAAAV